MDKQTTNLAQVLKDRDAEILKDWVALQLGANSAGPI